MNSMFSFVEQSYRQLTAGEKKFVWLAIVFVLLLTLVPVVYGVISAPDNLSYTNVTVLGGADKMVYLSQMEEARQGHWLFHNLYTAEAGAARIFSPVWLVLGWFGALTGLPNLFVFHLFRIIFGAAFLWLIYLLISKVISQINWRRAAFLAAALGAGFGIFTLNNPWSSENIYNTFATDLWVSEGNIFLTLYHSPLFILSQIFLILIFWWTIERLAIASWAETFRMSLVVLFLGIFHPYDLVIASAVLAVWFLIKSAREKKIRWPEFFKLCLIAFVGAFSFFYFFWLRKVDGSFALWSVQNVTLSPRFLNYVLGYGLFFVFYLFGIYRAVKSKNQYWFFLAIWSVVCWFLLFIPFLQFQRRMANGLHLPMALIAVLGFYLLAEFFKKKKICFRIFRLHWVHGLGLAILGIVLTLTTLYNISSDLVFSSTRLFPFYLAKEEKQAMIWLKDNLNQNSVILSSSRTGNLIPAYSARKVYVGHGHQTGNWLKKYHAVEDWFLKSNSGDEKKQAWLREEGIDYYFYGSQERFLGDFKPAEKDYLRLVFKSGFAEVYQVVIPEK